MLTKIGFSVDIAKNGIEAIHHLKTPPNSKSYNLVLMDCQMPEMDGYEASRCIRAGDATDYYRDIPIVALTANAMKGDIDKCFDAGMTEYLSKPIDQKRLISMIQKVLA